MTSLHPAPDAVLHLVKCGSKKDRCSNNRCSCRKANLPCTDLCTCSNDDDEPCENAERLIAEDSDSEDEDSEIVVDS